MKQKFIFDKMEVYQKAVEFANKVFFMNNQFSQKVQFSLNDQLRRAVLSVSSNIAEGSGRRHRAEKKQFFRTALASAFECIPILTIALNQNKITQKD